MKLVSAIYKDPEIKGAKYENVYIEDINYVIKRNESLFKVEFEMYCIVDGVKEKMGAAELAFKGTDEQSAQGLPTTNKTAVLKVWNQGYDPEIPQTIQSEEFVVIAEHEYVDMDGVTVIVPEHNEYLQIPNPAYIPETENVPLLQYLATHQGQMPEKYEVVDWGFPTYTAVMQYFTGGTLTEPELFIENPFAKQWFLNTLQMKGEPIVKQFKFV